MESSVSSVGVAAPTRSARISTNRSAWLGVTFVAAVVAWFFIALPYLTLRAPNLPLYDGERVWILLHISLGTIALLTGPVQLWLGYAHQRMALHRTMGKIYVWTILVGSVVAMRLAFTPSAGLVFGAGLGSLAIVWVMTTGMAYLAIRRRQIAQHREWMVRSYVVTFGFVWFRVMVAGMQIAGIGTEQEALAVSSWFCWALPLAIAEVAIQWKRTLGPARV